MTGTNGKLHWIPDEDRLGFAPVDRETALMAVVGDVTCYVRQNGRGLWSGGICNETVGHHFDSRDEAIAAVETKLRSKLPDRIALYAAHIQCFTEALEKLSPVVTESTCLV